MKFFLCFLIGLFTLSSLNSCEDASPHPAPDVPKLFKIGFEFQMGGKICANCPKGIQDQAIFSVFKKDRKLWDATVDYNDLEIRTVPFTNSEKDLLSECISSIEHAIKTLTQKNMQGRIVTFQEWLFGFDGDVFPGLQRFMTEKGLDIKVDREDLLTMELSVPADWFPHFKPQMTIQHHLGSTIPLLLSLYADKALCETEDSYIYSKSSMKNVLDELHEEADKATFFLILSVLNAFKKKSILPIFAINLPKHMEAIEGLLFLQLYTCFSLTHFSLPLVPGEQINAKRCISFMSRRPFSSMWKNIRGFYGEHSYESLYNEYVDSGAPHVFLDGQRYEMADRFQTVLYGAHYFASGKRCDFTNLRKFFKGAPKQLDEFLKIGNITTPMIHALDPDQVSVLDESGEVVGIAISDIFKNYYHAFLASVDNPTIRYDFEPGTEDVLPCIRQSKTNFDVLSPPYFLPSNDSMGAYKDDSQIDLGYGGAIVELRGIDKIGAYALRKMKIPEECSGIFLSQLQHRITDRWGNRVLDVSFQESVEKLFSFIEDRLGDSYPKAAESAGATH